MGPFCRQEKRKQSSSFRCIRPTTRKSRMSLFLLNLDWTGSAPLCEIENRSRGNGQLHAYYARAIPLRPKDKVTRYTRAKTTNQTNGIPVSGQL